MLKYKEIIEKLSVKQKIALLTDIKCLSNPEYVALGIPYTSLSTFEDILLETKEGVSSNILARSWSLETVKDMTEDLVSKAKERGTNFVMSPSPKMKLSPYVPAISEDPYLSGELVGSCLKAIHDAGVPAGVSGFRLDAEDVDYLDLELSKRIIYEYFICPFRIAAKQGECHSMMGSVSGPGNGYGDLNLKLMLSAEAGLFHVNMNMLCDEHTPEATAEVWHAGGIVLEGVATVLEQAHEKYKQIVRAIHEGHATVNDLEDAYADGSAISDEMMDAAVEKVIDFAFACGAERGEDYTCDEKDDTLEQGDVVETVEEPACEVEENNEAQSSQGSRERSLKKEEPVYKMPTFRGELEDFDENGRFASDELLKAIKESIVLLKNNNSLLPLRPSHKVAIIGDAAISGKGENFAISLVNKLNARCIGMAKGYAMNNDKNESYLKEAKRLTENADAVLLFLEIDSRRRDKLAVTKRLELPANQSALLETLKPYSNKIIAVVGGDILPAASLDESCGAMLLAPIGGENCVLALADVLCGKYNPSGRLTESYFDDPCTYFDTLRKNKDAKKNKIGPFMGYRLYDSSGETIRYPFGYGLSYTRFEYSGISVNGRTVGFYVKNAGSQRGTETAQVYIGKTDSAYIRPSKELKAFRRIELAPGEKKYVKVDISDFAIYDEKSEKFVIEQGSYTVYVGASVSDIRLTSVMTMIVEQFKSDAKKTEREADYLQTRSNILLDKYTLEAKGKKMKRSKKWKVGYIFGIILTAIVNALLIAARVYVGDDILILGKAIIAMLVIFDAFALSLIALAIVMDAKSIKKFRRLRSKEEKENLEAQFSDAKVLESMDIDDLFVKEFDEIFKAREESKPRVGFDLADYSRFVTDEMNFVVAEKTLVEAARRKGISIDDEFASVFLSAFASSRLLLLNSKEDNDIRRFTGALSDFFGTPEYFEKIDASFVGGELITAKNEDGSVRQTAIMDMLNAASEHKEKIYFAYLSDLDADMLTNVFSQYIRYLNNPERESKVALGDEKHVIPENVWFLVSTKDDESIRSMPVYLSELMMTVNVEFSEIVSEAKATISLEVDENADDGAEAAPEAVEEKTEEALPELQTLGYYQLSFMAEKCRNSFSMSEDLWKKVDSLEEYATKYSGYRFGNKLWLRFEKFLAVLKACEIEPSVALDNALNSILVDVLQIVLDGKLASDDRGLMEALEFYFGEDNVPVCRKTLKGVKISEE